MKKKIKKNRKRIAALTLTSLYIFGFVCIAFGGAKSPSSSPYEPPESVSEPISNTQEAVEEAPAIEPVKEQEEVIPEVVEEPAVEENELLPYEYFDVPLDLELQEYIFMVCELYEMEPAIIVAMIEKESTYRADCMGDNGRSYGLMQIQKRWHEQRMLDLGVTDLLDPCQNVAVGIDYISELQRNELGIYWSLMAYNGGIAYANRLREQDIVSDYAAYVVDRSEELGWRVW